MATSLTKEEINFRLKERNIILMEDYMGSFRKTKFSCEKGHIWEAMPANVLRGTKCPHCSLKGRTSTKEDINISLLERGIVLIGEYKNGRTKTVFKGSCGHIWEATPNNVLNGRNCGICAKTAKLNREIINQRLEKKEITLISEYKHIDAKSEFLCKCGHKWISTPYNLITRNGNCPKCYNFAWKGFKDTLPAILYYVKIKHNKDLYYKIGITNYNVKKRFSAEELNMIEIIFEKPYSFGKDAREKEQQILKEYSKFRYIGEPILSSGNTEIFTKNVLILEGL